MDSNIVNSNIVNEQEVSDFCDTLCELLDTVPHQVQLAALADAVANACDSAEAAGIGSMDRCLDYVRQRAWDKAHAVWVVRATPRPDNVTPLDRLK